MKTFTDFTTLLNEAVEYEYDDTKVIAKLTSYDSAPFTRLARNVQRIRELEDEISVVREAVKADTRDHVQSLFKAEDAIKTRIVQTVSLIVTLTKDPAPAKTVKYAEVIKEITKELTPELIEKLQELIKQYTTIQKAKPPALSIKPIKENVVTDFWKSMKDKLKGYFESVKSWASGYDKKLAKVKAMMKGIKA